MDLHTPASTTRARRFTQFRVILASALVFGVGATVTLASWNDKDVADATFTAGRFGIVGNATTAPESFIDHTVTTPAALAFSLAPTAMVPGTVTYALYSVKTISGGVAGNLTVSANPANAALTNLGHYLTYSVRTIAGTTCSSATFAAAGSVEVIPAGSKLDVGSVTPVAIAADGGQINYCFQVTLPTSTIDDAQGKAVTAVWTITAEAAAPAPAP
ncbi:MAG: hypothetical protein JWQ68_105 [Cryobacterium sp.]|jgi:predicted ribosomally synthesized peptide with SipW-like signal peptide|nr:hypothetical protein [Cryobacterium sp.]